MAIGARPIHVTVVGLGSIGRRRARILNEMPNVDLALYDIDARQHIILGEELGVGVQAHRTSAPRSFVTDVAFICTPPEHRVGTIKEWLDKALYLFIEKPATTTNVGIQELRDLGIENRITCACNMRYTLPETWPDELVELDLRMGQHRAYWKGHTIDNLALDSIHELDLAQHLLGPIVSIGGVTAPNYARIGAHHEGGKTSSILLDRTSDPPKRTINGVTSEGRSISMDLQTDKVDGMYRREMAHVLKRLQNGGPLPNPLPVALNLCEKVLNDLRSTTSTR